ncbi:hypothetical protein D3C81_1736030 [compost metagenome]
MCGAVVAKMQPVSTGVIVHLDVMDTMRNLGCISQVTQPLSILRSISGKIQNHSHASLQDIDDERAQYFPHLACKAHIIGH